MEEFLSAKEVCKLLKVSSTWSYKMAKQGRKALAGLIFTTVFAGMLIVSPVAGSRLRPVLADQEDNLSESSNIYNYM